jgi:hypothetical protein
MLQSFTSWSKAASGETKPEGDVPDRPPKTKSYPFLGEGRSGSDYWRSDHMEIRFGLKDLK